MDKAAAESHLVVSGLKKGHVRKFIEYLWRPHHDAGVCGPLSPSVHAESPLVATMPSQLFAAEAISFAFSTYYDLLVDSSGTAIRDSDDSGSTVLTHAQLRQHLARPTPASLGLGRCDRLCSALSNYASAATAFLAFALHCSYAPLNSSLGGAELVSEMESLPAAAVVVSLRSGLAAKVLDAAAACGLPTLVMAAPGGSVSARDGCYDLEWVQLPLQPSLRAVRAGRRDTCLVLCTSGSTSTPRRVALSHENVTTGALCISSTLRLEPSDVCLDTMPQFHADGLLVSVLSSLLSGGSVVWATPSSGAMLSAEALNRSKATWYSAVPTVHQQLLQTMEQPNAPPKHRLRLVRNCSATLLPCVAERLEARSKCLVLPSYQTPESIPVASNPRSARRKLRSVGVAAGPDVCVLGDSAAPCRAYQQGEICVRGACVAKGHDLRADSQAGPPNAAAYYVDAATGRWLRTGDMGSVDEEGHLLLRGRATEIIDCRGDRVSPLEVEDVLRRHPAVASAVAFAVRRSGVGEVVGLALVPRPGDAVSLSALRDGASAALPARALPEALVRLREIPTTRSGRLGRNGLAPHLGLPELPQGHGAVTSGTGAEVEICAGPRVWP